MKLYKTDYYVLRSSFFATLLLSYITILGMMCCVGNTIEPMLGATAQEIQGNSMIVSLKNLGWRIPSIIVGIFLITFIMLQYLENGFEKGVFNLPYKKDHQGNPVPKEKFKTYVEWNSWKL